MGVTRIFSQKHYCEIYRLLETRVNIEMLLTILLTAIDYAVNTNYFTFTNTGVIVEANKQIHSQATQLFLQRRRQRKKQAKMYKLLCSIP